eukprot:g6353.t1
MSRTTEVYGHVFAKKKSPAKDGVALFWRKDKLLPAGPEQVVQVGAQVAVVQDFWVLNNDGRTAAAAGTSPPTSSSEEIRIRVCAAHLKADKLQLGNGTSRGNYFGSESFEDASWEERARVAQLSHLMEVLFPSNSAQRMKKRSEKPRRLPVLLLADLNAEENSRTLRYLTGCGLRGIAPAWTHAAHPIEGAASTPSGGGGCLDIDFGCADGRSTLAVSSGASLWCGGGTGTRISGGANSGTLFGDAFRPVQQQDEFPGRPAGRADKMGKGVDGSAALGQDFADEIDHRSFTADRPFVSSHRSLLGGRRKRKKVKRVILNPGNRVVKANMSVELEPRARGANERRAKRSAAKSSLSAGCRGTGTENSMSAGTTSGTAPLGTDVTRKAVDWAFFSADVFSPVRMLGAPTTVAGAAPDAKCILPNENFPSDHIPLRVEFRLGRTANSCEDETVVEQQKKVDGAGKLTLDKLRIGEER